VDALSNNILIEKGQLSPWNYKNIVTVGLRLNKFEWVQHFIDEYKSFINSDFRESAYKYNIARYHYYKKEYSEVLRLIQQIEFEDVFYNLDSRTMILKIYYEEDEIEALMSFLDSFRIFLLRNKQISSYHKKNYLNLVRFTKRLINIIPGDIVKIEKLRKELVGTSNITESAWLLQQIELIK